MSLHEKGTLDVLQKEERIFQPTQDFVRDLNITRWMDERGIKSYDELLEKAGDIDTAGGTTPLFKSNLDMTIGKSKNIKSYENKLIHVSTRSDIPVLLGRNPIFEDYEITFKKQKNQLILKNV